MMKESTTIPFQDIETSEDSLAIVCHDQSNVSLCLSRKSDGDMEVVMTKADATKLIEALKKAITQK